MPGLADWIAECTRGRSVCVVGVGNPLCADDGAGPLVVGRLGGADGVRRIDAETTPENWYGHLLRLAPGVVLFVDAVDLGARPGTCLVAPVFEMADRLASTHAPSLRLLAGLLQRRGIDCWVLGIQPACTDPGAPVSGAVLEAVERAAGAIAASLAAEVSRA